MRTQFARLPCLNNALIELGLCSRVGILLFDSFDQSCTDYGTEPLLHLLREQRVAARGTNRLSALPLGDAQPQTVPLVGLELLEALQSRGHTSHHFRGGSSQRDGQWQRSKCCRAR
ncbi:hypothetical protein HYQ46_002748 [Verticillium longisporum]|nr:hypothetical protein HYQ46_002748 [Verticillium longisporum]